MLGIYGTLKVRCEGEVFFTEVTAPPMNLLGPELVQNLVSRAPATSLGLPEKGAGLALAGTGSSRA